MAVVTTYLQKLKLTHDLPDGSYAIVYKVALPAAAANTGDNIQLVTVLRMERLASAVISLDNTLGASATLKLQLNRGGTRTDLGTATTAGGASSVRYLGAPVDFLPGDIVEAVVGGGNITAAANLAIDLHVQRY